MPYDTIKFVINFYWWQRIYEFLIRNTWKINIKIIKKMEQLWQGGGYIWKCKKYSDNILKKWRMQNWNFFRKGKKKRNKTKGKKFLKPTKFYILLYEMGVQLWFEGAGKNKNGKNTKLKQTKH